MVRALAQVVRKHPPDVSKDNLHVPLPSKLLYLAMDQALPRITPTPPVEAGSFGEPGGEGSSDLFSSQERQGLLDSLSWIIRGALCIQQQQGHFCPTGDRRQNPGPTRPSRPMPLTELHLLWLALLLHSVTSRVTHHLRVK